MRRLPARRRATAGVPDALGRDMRAIVRADDAAGDIVCVCVAACT